MKINFLEGNKFKNINTHAREHTDTDTYKCVHTFIHFLNKKTFKHKSVT